MNHKTTLNSDWREEGLPPFNEAVISWNASRPLNGNYLFYVSIKTNTWSPWLLYATWGSDGQTSYQTVIPDANVKVYQDAIEVGGSNRATGFQIRIVTEGSATLEAIHGLHVYTNGDASQTPPPTFVTHAPIQLPVSGLSQMTVNHIRCTDLCSPTSTTAVVRYLSHNLAIDPVHFAKNTWDKGFDIFGNWVFAVAQASSELGPEWNCWVERLQSFGDIYNHLCQGIPVIVSIRGPLSGSAQPYAKGHLLAVIGYDPQQQKVLCMDPAFPSDNQTHVYYDISNFIEAWNRRGKIAYIFTSIKKSSYGLAT